MQMPEDVADAKAMKICVKRDIADVRRRITNKLKLIAHSVYEKI